MCRKSARALRHVQCHSCKDNDRRRQFHLQVKSLPRVGGRELLVYVYLRPPSPPWPLQCDVTAPTPELLGEQRTSIVVHALLTPDDLPTPAVHLSTSPLHRNRQQLHLPSHKCAPATRDAAMRRPRRSKAPAWPWSSVHSWLLYLRSGPLSAPALLPGPTPVLHMSAPVHRGAVADDRLGMA